jgi:hypothetical protein
MPSADLDTVGLGLAVLFMGLGIGGIVLAIRLVRATVRDAVS